MSALLTLLVCLVLCGICNGNYTVACGDGEGLSFEEAGDGVEGRYRMKWCTRADGVMVPGTWTLSLRCNQHRKPEDCVQYNIRKPPGELHSRFEEDVAVDVKCTYVCFSTTLDLIFNGACYTFKTSFKPEPGHSWPSYGSYDYVLYVNNNYSKEHFSESQAVVSIIPTGDHVTAEWFLGYVPATDYVMNMCDEQPSEANELETCTPVSDNCTSGGAASVACRLWPRARAFRLRLQHAAPWCSGHSFFPRLCHLVHDIDGVNVNATVPESVSGAGGGAPSVLAWAACGAALALAAGAGAAACARRSLLARKLRERVRLDWRARARGDAEAPAKGAAAAEAEGSAGAEGSGSAEGVRVLLLYARDCAPLMAFAASLRALLEETVGHVYDVYSAEVVAAAARAPGEWVRRAAQRGDVRVLLLQTRAAAALHAPALAARGARLTMEQPLLNRRAMYRAPHSSDALLPLALRLLADGAHAPHAYRKYYVATIEGLETELVPAVTPLRRYRLPGAAALLARDLRAAAPHQPQPHQPQPHQPQPQPSDAALERLAAAARELAGYVTRTPDYLEEELVFFDYDA